MVLYQVCGLLESNTDREPNPANPESGQASGQLQGVVKRPTALTRIPALAENGADAIARGWWGGSVWTPIDTTAGRPLVSAVDIFQLGLSGAPSPANPFASEELTAATASGELTAYFGPPSLGTSMCAKIFKRHGSEPLS
jgi:hypothetical protein